MEGLGEIINRVAEEPLLLWAAFILSLFLVVGIVKRVLSIIVSCSVLLIVYMVYVTYFEELFPTPDLNLDAFHETGRSLIEMNSEPSPEGNGTE